MRNPYTAKTYLDGKVLEVRVGWFFGTIKVYYGGKLVDMAPPTISTRTIRFPNKLQFTLNKRKIKIVNPPGFFEKPIIIVDGVEAQLLQS